MEVFTTTRVNQSLGNSNQDIRNIPFILHTMYIMLNIIFTKPFK
jgi:hypothetical protein